MKTNVPILALLLSLSGQSAMAQDSLTVRRDTFPSEIRTEFLEDGVRFRPVIRPLVPIPGGRQAFYTYLWDFGDGNFSTEEAPVHQYADSGEYDISLYIVNNYDNGPRPKKPKTKVKVDKMLARAGAPPNRFERNFFKSNGVFQIFKNADALPGEDMSLVVGVRPEAGVSGKGTVLILTNEKLINPNGFVVAGQSRYNGEQIVPAPRPGELQRLWANVGRASVTQSGSPDYGLREELEFGEGEADRFFSGLLDEYTTVSQYDIEAAEGQAQFSIINLDVTPEMLADTNAIVTVTGIYLAEGGNSTVHKLDIPIIKSHDPNKMSVRPALMDYRLQFRKKKLTYKVQFQNDGEGDARDIRLEMHFPEQIDTRTFQLLSLYPQCDSCRTDSDLGCYTYQTEDDRITFRFRGIALPGTASPTVTDRDSTKGFVRFALRSHKKLQNRSFPSHTDIYFDKNEPIRTNRAVSRFRPGLSPFVSLGLNAPGGPSARRIGKLTVGPAIAFGIAPIAPYRKPYWQVGLSVATFGTEHERTFTDRRGEMMLGEEDNGRPAWWMYNRVDSTARLRYASVQLPVQVRYNWSRWFSAGIGALVKTNINTVNEQQNVYYLQDQSVPGIFPALYPVAGNATKEKMSRPCCCRPCWT